MTTGLADGPTPYETGAAMPRQPKPQPTTTPGRRAARRALRVGVGPVAAGLLACGLLSATAQGDTHPAPATQDATAGPAALPTFAPHPFSACLPDRLRDGLAPLYLGAAVVGESGAPAAMFAPPDAALDGQDMRALWFTWVYRSANPQPGDTPAIDQTQARFASADTLASYGVTWEAWQQLDLTPQSIGRPAEIAAGAFRVAETRPLDTGERPGAPPPPADDALVEVIDLDARPPMLAELSTGQHPPAPGAPAGAAPPPYNPQTGGAGEGGGGVQLLGSTGGGGGGGGGGLSTGGGSGGGGGGGGGGGAAAPGSPAAGNGASPGTRTTGGSDGPDASASFDDPTGVFGRVVGAVVVVGGADVVAWPAGAGVRVLHGQPIASSMAVAPNPDTPALNLRAYLGGSVAATLPSDQLARTNSYIVLWVPVGHLPLEVWSKAGDPAQPDREAVAWNANVTQRFDPAILLD